MFKKIIRKAGLAVLATASIVIAGMGLVTTAKAAPIHINPIPATELVQDSDLIEVFGRHGSRSHRGRSRSFNRGHRSRGFNRGHRGRSFNRGHRGRSFNRGHRGRSFNRGHRGRSFNRGHRGRSFNRGHGHSFKSYKFSRHGGFRHGGRRF